MLPLLPFKSIFSISFVFLTYNRVVNPISYFSASFLQLKSKSSYLKLSNVLILINFESYFTSTSSGNLFRLVGLVLSFLALYRSSFSIIFSHYIGLLLAYSSLFLNWSLSCAILSFTPLRSIFNRIFRYFVS